MVNLNPDIMSEEIKHKESDRRGMFYMEDDKGNQHLNLPIPYRITVLC
jgi:hypothetical protein